MALINKLLSLTTIEGVFGARQKKEDLNLLRQGIDLLRSSACYTLQKKLTAEHGIETAVPLAVAVVSAIILEPPTDVRSRVFYEKNLSMICQQALVAHKDQALCGPSGCVSYLYAGKILYCEIVNQPISNEGKVWRLDMLLRQQAADLSIEIASSADICGSDDKAEIIRSIFSFAKAFYYTNTWSGTTAAVSEIPFPSIPYEGVSSLGEADKPLFTEPEELAS